MKIKQKPEDFSVKESYRFDESKDGKHRVYLMDKQKLSTYEAVERITRRFGLRPGAVSFCGLKDKQGRTEQLIAVDGADVDIQDPDLRLKYLGRVEKPLTSANTTSNRFSVTVRALTEDETSKLNLAAAEVNRLGVVNYFDSQRFGSLKHGQGFIAKDLLRGDFEAALRNYLARPSPLDRSEDAKVKSFWKLNWGKWDRRAPFAGSQRYDRVLGSLREYPTDFVRAFLQIDSSYRALQLFTYQSYLWNEGARRLMQLVLPRENLFPMPYQAGTLLFHTQADKDTLAYLRNAQFPLLAPDTVIEDPKIQEAVTWVLGKEKLALSDLRIKENPKLLFFKHELRPLLVQPHKLVLGRMQSDEINRGLRKLNVAFTLPPGSYATLVTKRLFHFSDQSDKHEATPHESEPKPAEDRPSHRSPSAPAPERPARRERFDRDQSRPPRPVAATSSASAPAPAPATNSKAPRQGAAPRSPLAPARAPAKAPVAAAKAEEPRGFRAHQRERKAQKRAAQAVTKAKRPKAT